MKGLVAGSSLLCLVVAAPGLGQFGGYTAPGSFAGRPTSKVEQFEGAMDAAPWSLGRLFVDPWIGISDLNLVLGSGAGSNDPGRDLGATFSLGVQVYRPVASELVFEAHFLPAYVWFRDQIERRRINGAYGMGLYGNLGRTKVGASVSRNDESRFLSNELLQRRVNERNDRAEASLNIELVSGMAIFGSASSLRVRTLEDENLFFGNLSSRDRVEDVYRAGLRFRSRRGFQLGLALEESEVVFEDTLFDRSNFGTSPVVELGLGGDRLWLGADVVFRSLKPLGGSQFVAFEGVTGLVEISWRARPRLEVELSSRRDLDYSITSTWAYFESEIAHLGLTINLTSLDQLRFFAEQGRDEYTDVVPGLQPRIDDVDSYGVNLSVRLALISLRLGWSRTTFDSTLQQFDRRLDVFSTGIGIGGGLELRP